MWTAIAGATGTVIGGTISIVANRRANQMKLAFEMHKEFNTREMSETRTQAQQFLLEHPDDASLSMLYDQHPIRTNHVWLIIQFYQRLWLAVDNRQIKASLVSPLFGELFIWWHRNCFEKQLFPVPGYAEVSEHLRELRAWLGRKTNADTMSEWQRRADMTGNPVRRVALAARPPGATSRR